MDADEVRALFYCSAECEGVTSPRWDASLVHPGIGDLCPRCGEPGTLFGILRVDTDGRMHEP